MIRYTWMNVVMMRWFRIPLISIWSNSLNFKYTNSARNSSSHVVSIRLSFVSESLKTSKKKKKGIRFSFRKCSRMEDGDGKEIPSASHESVNLIHFVCTPCVNINIWKIFKWSEQLELFSSERVKERERNSREEDGEGTKASTSTHSLILLPRLRTQQYSTSEDIWDLEIRCCSWEWVKSWHREETEKIIWNVTKEKRIRRKNERETYETPNVFSM